MKLSERVKPISRLKARASEIIRDVNDTKQPVIITLNGEAKAIVQDLETYEQLQDSLALLKILATSQKSKRLGEMNSVEETFKSIRKEVED